MEKFSKSYENFSMMQRRTQDEFYKKSTRRSLTFDQSFL